MNKKILSWIVLAMLVFNLSAFADTLPDFPMSLWWTVKNWTTSITSWTVQVYNGLTKVWEIAIWSNWQYGWNTAFDNKITLTEFTWSLDYKLITWWLTYNLTSSNITKINSANCSANTNITFVSDVCQYDLNLNANTPTCDPASVTNWLVNSTTCVITCNTWYNLSWTSCVLQSNDNGNSSWWSSGGGSSGGWDSTPSICLDSQLECKTAAWVYKFYRKTWVSCNWWNLWKTCTITNTSTWSTNSWSLLDDNQEDTKELSEIVREMKFEDIKETWDNWWNDNQEDTKETWDNWWNDNQEDTEETWEKIIIKDIKNSFAKSYIDRLVRWWIANWYNDNTFRPEDPSTRVEYIKMVLRSMNINYSNTDTSKLTFLDVKKDSWEAKVIAKALELKIIDWKNKYFRPNSNISRAESMKILIIAWWFIVDEKTVSSFADVSWWSVKYIEKAKQLWIVNWQLVDSKLLFRPLDNISRWEVAKIVIKLMDILSIWK